MYSFDTVHRVYDISGLNARSQLKGKWRNKEEWRGGRANVSRTKTWAESDTCTDAGGWLALAMHAFSAKWPVPLCHPILYSFVKSQPEIIDKL